MDGDTDFEKIFNEEVAKDPAINADDDAGGDDGDGEEEPEKSAPGEAGQDDKDKTAKPDGSEGAAVEGEKGAAEKPADPAKTGEQVSAKPDDKPSGDGKGADEQGQPPSASKDPPQEIDWSTATPEQRAAHEAASAELERLRQSDKSQKGRLAAVQRVSNLTNRLEALRASGADTSQMAGKIQDYLANDRFKAFADENPEFAEHFTALGGLVSELATGVQKHVTTVTQEAAAPIVDDIASYVLGSHPDFNDVMASPAFKDWAKSQPEGGFVKAGIAKNAQAVVDAEWAVEIVDKFKATRDMQQRVSGQGQGDPPGNSAGGVDPAKDSLRNRRRETGAATRINQPGGVGSSAPNDFDKAFEHFVAEDERSAQKHRRRA